jgi:hypothetical protein
VSVPDASSFIVDIVDGGVTSTPRAPREAVRGKLPDTSNDPLMRQSRRLRKRCNVQRFAKPIEIEVRHAAGPSR